MLRTQVQFTEAQYRRLRMLAQRRGVSISQVVRESVQRHLDAESSDAEALYSRACEVIGAYDDRENRDDLAANHDEYLDEAFR
jgi:hypothetical protein